MATKKRRTKRKATHKNRRVGAVHTMAAKRRSSPRRKVGAINTTTEIILGAIAGAFVTRVIEKNLPAPKDAKGTDFRPYTGLVVGAAAEFFGKKNLLIRSMGIGALVEGARSIIDDKYIPSFTNKAVKGLPYTTGMTTRMINAPRRIRTLAGTSNTGGLAGVKGGLAGSSMSNHSLYAGGSF
jgi:hypothetical protein